MAAPVLEEVVVRPRWTHVCRELVEQHDLGVVDDHEEASEVSVPIVRIKSFCLGQVVPAFTDLPP